MHVHTHTHTHTHRVVLDFLLSFSFCIIYIISIKMNPRLKTHALDHFMLRWKYYFSTTKGSLENKRQKYEVWTLFVTFLFINSNITGIYFIILSSLFFFKWSYQSSPQASVTVTSEFGCSFIRNRNTSQSPFLLPALSCCSQMLFTCFSSIILYFVLFGKIYLWKFEKLWTELQQVQHIKDSEHKHCWHNCT